MQNGSTFVARNSAIIGSHESGVVTFETGAVASLTDSSIEDTSPDDLGTFGVGAIASPGSRMELNSCTVTRSGIIGVAAAGAAVALRSSFVSLNPTGVHAQDGMSVSTSSQVELTPGVFGVSSDTRFVANGTVTGSGNVPLPTK